jgi:light-independent protochlorophyllide reductase subunit B
MRWRQPGRFDRARVHRRRAWGTYSREFAREIREAALLYGVEPLVTDRLSRGRGQRERLQPELVLGTQMERHIAKRLGVPCAVISAPVHVQDYPARYSPQMGFEGANVLFDTWVHPLMMGLEEHLIGMFRGMPSFTKMRRLRILADHRSRCRRRRRSPCRSRRHRRCRSRCRRRRFPFPGRLQRPSAATLPRRATHARLPAWEPSAEEELRKIPFFVRGKAKRNTEKFALERAIPLITIDTLYDAKAHFSR